MGYDALEHRNRLEKLAESLGDALDNGHDTWEQVAPYPAIVVALRELDRISFIENEQFHTERCIQDAAWRSKQV